MKILSAILSALCFPVFACGGVDNGDLFPDLPDGGELGVAQQPIYMPASYGSEHGDQSRCDANWSGGICVVPDARAITFSVSGCGSAGTSLFDQIGSAFNYVASVVNVAPYGWNLVRNDSWGAAVNYQIVCKSDTFGSPMVTHFAWNGSDCHDTSRGDLCQSGQGSITVRLNVIDDASGWATATTMQRGKFINNMMRHELGHVLGLGHEPGAGHNKLMRAAFTSAPIPGVVNPWDNRLVFDATELHALDCYNESSNTDDRC